MAGDWIKLEVATLDKPEVRQMARVLGVKHGEALELLLRFWAWMDKVSVDGYVDGLVERDVDEMMRCEGFCAVMQMVKWMVVDKDAQRISLPNYDRHNGESSKKRALTNRSQAKWRKNVDGFVDGHVDGGASTKASTREEKRRDIDTSVSIASKKLAVPSDEHRSLAAELGVDCEAQFLRYRDWLAANGKSQKDERAGFRNWLRKAAEYKKGPSRSSVAAELFGEIIDGESRRVA